jgi:hypothetical protein
MIRSLLWTFALLAAALSALSTAFFWHQVRESRVLMDELLASSLHGVPPEDTDAVVLALSRSIYARTNRRLLVNQLPPDERWEATSFFNITAGTSLENGIYGVTDRGVFGPCGTMSRVLLNALWRLGIPARKLQLLASPGSGLIQHTMVEYRSGDRWQVISPSDSSFEWHNHAGQVATVDEIRADPAIFEQVHAWRGWWPANFDHTAHIRWEKLPSPVRGGIRILLGPKRYEQAETPRWYDQSRRFLLNLSVVALLLSGAGTWLLSPWRWRRHSRPDVDRYGASVTTA